MKRLSEKLWRHLSDECARCSNAIPTLIPEFSLDTEKRNDQFMIFLMRSMYTREAFVDEASWQKNKREFDVFLESKGVSVQPGPEDDLFPTTLSLKIVRHLSAAQSLLLARMQDDSAKIEKANLRIEEAKRELRKLNDLTTGEVKDITAAAVKEFDAMAMIARSNDPMLTREKAHTLLARQR